MIKKTYSIENLGCANCAAKMEAKMNALPQVQEATITFATRKLCVTADNPDALLPALQSIVSAIEADAKISPEQRHPREHGCGHDHPHGYDQEHHAGCDLKLLLTGAGLFLFGLVLEGFHAAVFGIPVSSVIFTVCYLLLGAKVLTTAGKNLLKGQIFDEHFLMSVATVGAVVIGEFPEAASVILFYRVGQYFEEKAIARSRSQIMAAVDLRPETVTLADGQTVPAEKIETGELLLVRPGDRIPLDSIVVRGQSRIDTAPITGESVPITVAPGDAVTSGCMNLSGQLTVRVEKPLEESMVTRILHAVEHAAASKPKVDRFITRFARVYTPVVVLLAVLTAVVPSLISGSWDYWVYTSLSFLVMSCPCALVLSVPLAFFSGIGAGSRKGILFKGGLSIEALAGIKAVAVDKTGTVTKGEFRVQSCTGRADTLAICAACEQSSTHPIAVSIVAAAKAQGLSLEAPEELEEFPGQGIRARLRGRTVLCGNETLMARFGVPAASPAESGSLVLVAVDGAYIGCILVADTIKPGAADAFSRLKSLDIHTVMLTGDNPENARAVAESVGITEVHPRLLPQQKLTALQTLQAQQGATMFVGDGINDAPVLAGADVGAAMGSGADAAIEAADVVYITSDVGAIPESVMLARRTRRIAWQNVIFALAVKLAVMLLGLLGHASMWMAVFADSGVALLCVLNSVRLLYAGKQK